MLQQDGLNNRDENLFVRMGTKDISKRWKMSNFRQHPKQTRIFTSYVREMNYEFWKPSSRFEARFQ